MLGLIRLAFAKLPRFVVKLYYKYVQMNLNYGQVVCCAGLRNRRKKFEGPRGPRRYGRNGPCGSVDVKDF